MNLGQLRIVPVMDIVLNLEKRRRKNYGFLDELADSIAELGLIHPIAVYSPNGEPPYEVVAGARRFRAITEYLKWPEISCRIYDTPMTEDELRAVELYENFDRKDFTDEDVAEFHDIQVRRHGRKIARSANAPGHSIQDTANMIGMSRSTVSRSIKAAEESSAARDKLERYEVPSIPAVQMNASKLTAADLDKYSDEQLRQIAERIKSQQAASKPVRKVSPAAVNDAEAVIIARVLKELKDAYSIPLHETTRLSQQECADFRKVYEMIGTRLFFSPTAAELMGLLKILVEITVQASQKQGE